MGALVLRITSALAPCLDSQLIELTGAQNLSVTAGPVPAHIEGRVLSCRRITAQ